MYSIKFQIGETDKSGPRNITARGPDWKVVAPNRVLTSTEINAATDVLKAPIGEFEYPHDIVEIRKKFDLDRLSKLTRSNPDYINELTLLKRYSGHYNKDGRFVFLRADRDIDVRITEAQNKALMQIQYEIGLPTISIHEDCRTASPSNLDARIKQSLKDIEEFRDTKLRNPHIEPVVVISVRCDDAYEFYEKLDVARKYGIDLFCIENGKSIDAYHNSYVKLKEFVVKNPEILVIGANTEKTMRGMGIASGPHVMNLLGQDVAGIKMPRYYYSEEESYQPSRFERSTGGIMPRSMQETHFGENLNCSCPVCLNKSRSQFYGYARKKLLSPACKVHEVFDSRELFKETRMNMGDMKTFIPQKTHLAEGLARIGINFRQKGLGDFFGN